MVRRPSRISCLIARSLLKSSQVRVEKKKKRYLWLVFSILVMVCVRHQSSCNFVVVFRTRSLILVESKKRKKRKTQGFETQMHLEPLEPSSTTSNWNMHWSNIVMTREEWKKSRTIERRATGRLKIEIGARQRMSPIYRTRSPDFPPAACLYVQKLRLSLS